MDDIAVDGASPDDYCSLLVCAGRMDEEKPPGTVPGELTLDRERQQLGFAGRCLAQMRDTLRSLDVIGGDAVSTEYLKAELFRRAQAMLDDPSTPLFFGRIDRAGGRERFYIGRRHVRDDAGDPVVIDWRADVSRGFYRASPAEPMGIGLRRRFGFSAGVMTGFEDEHLDRGEFHDPAHSAILTAEIERPRAGPMRDIVATIQPDQDALVRAGLDDTLCVQGAPGTGKTAVGLHRAAYLLYAHRDQLRRTGVLVIGPNRSFLGYIGDLLPALGELDVEQIAVADIPGEVPLRGTDTAEVDALKGEARMAEVIRRAVFSGVTEPTETLVVDTGPRRHRVPVSELVALMARERAGQTPYDVTRARLPRLIAEAIRRRMEAGGGAPDDRAVAQLARGRDIKDWVDAHWPRMTAPDVVMRLLTDQLFLARHADGVLTPEEQRLVLWEHPPRSTRSAPWSRADRFLLDEAAGCQNRPRGYGHIVIDEAQDLTPMQCRSLARRCPTGSFTILGDLAQATTPGAVADWPRLLAFLGRERARMVELTTGYRVPDEVIAVANRLLPSLGVAVAPAASLRHSPGSMRTLLYDGPAALAETITALLGQEGSIGIIATPSQLDALRPALAGLPVADVDDGMSARVTLVPVQLCKGLEFDHVVVVEPEHILEALPRGRHWLYVALTRAVTSLTVAHSDRLPEALRPAG